MNCHTYSSMKQFCQSFKGYLCYKTITSQNASFAAQFKKFFISWESYVLFSRYSSFCIFNHPMIYQICDVIMSIYRVHFWIYLLNYNSLSHQTWPINRYKDNKIQESFEQFRGLRLISMSFFNVATCFNYSITNYVQILMFHFFEKVNKEHLKMVNVNY